MTNNYKKDLLASAFETLDSNERMTIHNLCCSHGFNPYNLEESTIHAMDEFNELHKGLTPLEIAFCISNGSFDASDCFYYCSDYMGEISLNSLQYGCEPIGRIEDYIENLLNFSVITTGVEKIDKILKMPDMDPAELEDELYCKIDSACDRIIKAVAKKYNLDIISSEQNGFNEMLDLEHELAETLYKIIFADNVEM